MQLRDILFTVIILALTNGCTSRHYEQSSDIRGIYNANSKIDNVTRENPDKRLSVYQENQYALDKKYPEERKYLASEGRSTDGTPALGLALSGGGPRSASFSIGVMKALRETGHLDKVDVISSVSGGSYASYWYFSQNCYMNKTDDETYCNASSDLEKSGMIIEPDGSSGMMVEKYNKLVGQFKPGDIFNTRKSRINDPLDYRFQGHLQQSSDILSLSKEPGFWRGFRNYSEVGYKAVLHLITLPAHWVANGVFDWNWNGNPSRKFYENGLERTYGYVPVSYNLEQYINGESMGFLPRTYATDISFMDIRKYLEKAPKKNGFMPYFIINATGGHDRAWNQFDSGPLNKREMRKAIFEFTPWRCGSDLFGYWDSMKCGQDISFSRAVAISGAAVDRQQEGVDLAGYGQGVSLLNTYGQLLNVFNGNLGYRIDNPKNTEENSYLRKLHYITPFPLYYLYKYSETPPGIHLSDGGHSENLGVFSLVRRGTKNIIVVDAEEDKKTIFEAANRLKVQLERELGLTLRLKEDNLTDNYNTPISQAIATGTISGLIDDKGNSTPITVTYIKLSVDDYLLSSKNGSGDANYPFTVTNYKNIDKSFPHNSTTDIFYSDDQYRAYRDLGYSIAFAHYKGPPPDDEMPIYPPTISLCETVDKELFECYAANDRSYFLYPKGYKLNEGEWFYDGSSKYVEGLLASFVPLNDYQVTVTGYSTQKPYRCDNLAKFADNLPKDAKIQANAELAMLKTSVANSKDIVREAFCFKKSNEYDDGNIFLSELRALWFADQLQKKSKGAVIFKDVRGVGPMYSDSGDKASDRTIAIQVDVER